MVEIPHHESPPERPQTDIAERLARFEADLGKLCDESASRLAEAERARQNHVDELQRLKTTQEREIERITVTHQAEITHLRENQTDQLTRVTATHDREIDRITTAHQAEIAQLTAAATAGGGGGGGVEVGANSADGDSRLFFAKEAVRQGELMLASQSTGLDGLLSRTSSLFGWTVTVSVGLTAAISSTAWKIPAATTGLFTILSAACCILALWPRGWRRAGNDPAWFLREPYGTELETLEAAAGGYARNTGKNAKRLNSSGYWLRAAWSLFGAAPLVGIATYAYLAYSTATPAPQTHGSSPVTVTGPSQAPAPPPPAAPHAGPVGTGPQPGQPNASGAPVKPLTKP